MSKIIENTGAVKWRKCKDIFRPADNSLILIEFVCDSEVSYVTGRYQKKGDVVIYEFGGTVEFGEGSMTNWTYIPFSPNSILTVDWTKIEHLVILPNEKFRIIEQQLSNGSRIYKPQCKEKLFWKVYTIWKSYIYKDTKNTISFDNPKDCISFIIKEIQNIADKMSEEEVKQYRLKYIIEEIKHEISR